MYKKTLSTIILIFLSLNVSARWDNIQIDNNDAGSGYTFSITTFTQSGKYSFRRGEIGSATLYKEVSYSRRNDPMAYPSGFFESLMDHKEHEQGFAYKKKSYAVLKGGLPSDCMRIIFEIKKINNSEITGRCELTLSVEDMKNIINYAGMVGINITDNTPTISTFH